MITAIPERIRPSYPVLSEILFDVPGWPCFAHDGGNKALGQTGLARRIPYYPMVSFQVEQIEQVVAELKRRGCQFQALPESASFADKSATKQGEIMDCGPVKSAFCRPSDR